MPTITQTDYGFYTHGTPEHVGHGSYYRVDHYTSPSRPEFNGPDRMACHGSQDDSAPWTGRYNSMCPCCWLGHGHTTAYHQQHSKEQ